MNTKKYLKQVIKKILNIQIINFTITRSLKKLGMHNCFFLTRRVYPTGVLNVSINELKIKLHGGEDITSRLWWHGSKGFEEKTTKLFIHLAKKSQSFLDIGAHIGWYSILAKKMNPEIKVWALEPNPPVFEQLIKNVAANEISINCEKKAASDTNGTKLFYLGAPGLSSSSGLRPEVGGDSTIIVETIAIDKFIANSQIEILDLIKIDVEGHELEVLKGMEQTILSMHPIIIFEVSQMVDNYDEIYAYLGGFNYAFYCIELEQYRNETSCPAEFKHVNYIAVPKNQNSHIENLLTL